MFGIGVGELFFIFLVALMLFGADKVPDIARTLGKAMANLKNATNEIKSEITKSADSNGLDFNKLSKGFTDEVDGVKKSFTNMIVNNTEIISKNQIDISTEIKEVKNDFEELTGTIKRK